MSGSTGLGEPSTGGLSCFSIEESFDQGGTDMSGSTGLGENMDYRKVLHN